MTCKNYTYIALHLDRLETDTTNLHRLHQGSCQQGTYRLSYLIIIIIMDEN